MDRKWVESSLEQTEQLSRYHLLILFCLLITAIPQGAVNFSPVFVFYTPPHRCFIPEIDRAIVESDGEALRNATDGTGRLESYIPNRIDEGQKVFSKCERYNGTLDTSITNNSRAPSPRPCDRGWHYSGKKQTAVTEFDLVCGGDWKLPVFTQGYSVGALVSGIVCGAISDRLGRRFATLSSITVLMLVIIGYSFAPTYEASVVGFVAFGFGSSATYSTVFVHVQELVKTSHRDIAACLMNICMSTGYMLMPLLAYYVDNWRWMVRIPGLFCVPLMSYFWFLPESPLWLLLRGRPREAVAILRRILKNVEITEDTTQLADLKDKEDLAKGEDVHANGNLRATKKESFSKALLAIFRSRILLLRTAIICWMWIVSFICFYTFGYGTSNLAGNIYLNSLFAAAVEVPGWIVALIMQRKFGRRISLATGFAFSAVFCAACAAFSSYGTFSIVLAMIGKIFSASTMGMVYLYTAELYPTVLRSTGVGVASASARIACLVAPVLVFLGKDGDTRITFYCMSALGFLATILTLLLPETRCSILPETIQDSLALEKHRIKISCVKRKKQAPSLSPTTA